MKGFEVVGMRMRFKKSYMRLHIEQIDLVSIENFTKNSQFSVNIFNIVFV
jgi:hypothetical protein